MSLLLSLSSLALNTLLVAGSLASRSLRHPVCTRHVFVRSMSARFSTEARGQPHTEDYRLFFREWTADLATAASDSSFLAVMLLSLLRCRC